MNDEFDVIDAGAPGLVALQRKALETFANVAAHGAAGFELR